MTVVANLESDKMLKRSRGIGAIGVPAERRSGANKSEMLGTVEWETNSGCTQNTVF